MPSEKSGISFLQARERRQEILAELLAAGTPPLIFLSLNIAGSDKNPPGAEALYGWGVGEMTLLFPALRLLEVNSDLLGPYAIISLDQPPAEIKRRCVAIETAHPFSRLLDLDVYAADGRQIDRGSLGLPSRSCLICNHPATECIRLKRHSAEEVILKTNELLTQFAS